MKKASALLLLITLFTQLQAQQLDWVTVTTSTGSPINTTASTIRDDGFVVVTGSIAAYGSGSDFDPGPSSATLLPTGGTSGFVACYDANGNYSWAFNIGSSSGTLTIRDVASDMTNNIYITGTLEQTQNVDFDPGTGTAFLSSYNLANSLFVAKYDVQGNYLWAFALSSPGSGGYGNSIDISPSGEVVIAGSVYNDWNAQLDLNPLGATQNISTGGYELAFIGWYSTQGNYIRHACANGSVANSRYRCARTNAAGEVFACGETLGFIGAPVSIDFDPGPGTAFVNQPTNQINTFLVCFSPAGNFRWLNDYSGQIQKYNIHLAPDNSGNVILGAMFMGVGLDFDTGPGVQIISGNGIDFTAVLAKYDNNGNYIWALGITGATLASVSIDQKNAAYCTGFFNNSAQLCDFDPGTGVANIIIPGTYVGKYDSLGNYRSAFGIGAVASGTTRPAEILVGNQGEITLSGNFDQTVDFDPSTGNTIISASNSTSNMFLARYDLKTSLSPVLNASELHLFPNPFSDMLTLHNENIYEPLQITIFNTAGQLIATKTALGSVIYIEETLDLPAGIYYVNINCNQKKVYSGTVIKSN
jgi:Secretion system C-terminal sorting domain